MLTSSLLSPFSRRASWIGPSSPSMNLLGSGPLPGRLAHSPSVIHWLFACLWGWQVYGPSASAAPAAHLVDMTTCFPWGVDTAQKLSHRSIPRNQSLHLKRNQFPPLF